MAVEYKDLPFDEAIQYFRHKINMPTQRWDDLLKGQHAKAFVIAGAAKDELLSDLRRAIDRAIVEGTTLQTFRKEFDRTVAKHGWSYNGTRGWRTDVMLSTNIRTAYHAGRYKQMTDPEMLALRPYWEYRHGNSVHPRQEHLSWDGLLLRHDNPWWDTHYPPNGWGCTCKVFARSQRDLERAGKRGPDGTPKTDTYTWTDRVTGEVQQVPVGIDPGWDYNVGASAWGKPVATQVLEAEKGGKWIPVRGRSPDSFGRPKIVPTDSPVAKLGPRARSQADLETLWEAAIGSQETQIADPAGAIILLTKAVVEHIKDDRKRFDGREQFFPILPEVIKSPYEIWVGFAQNTLTGEVGIRRRYVKTIALDKERVVGFIATAVRGVWVSFDMFRGRRSALNRLRTGYLVWGRK